MASLIAVAALLMASCATLRTEPRLEAFLESRMKALGAVGFGAGIVRDDRLVWSHVWGTADKAAGAPVTVDTVFRICSISKAITGLAAMAAVEHGMLDLDADIGTYLPHQIRNRRYPDVAITARMLMSHSSSIIDDWAFFDPLTSVPEPAMPLADLVREALAPDGQTRRRESWLDAPPGTAAVYSNLGIATLAAVIESATGTAFEAWTDRMIVEPLGMRDVAWFESRLPAGTPLGRPYGFHREAIEQWHVPQWPAGSLLASVRGFAPLAAVFINRGVVGGKRILRETSLEAMERPTAGRYGLALLVPVNHPADTRLRGHYGDMPGFHSGFLYDPQQRVGAYYFANGQFYHTMLRAEVESALIDAARGAQ